MSRVVNAAVIGIAVFILLAGSFWYLSVAQGTEKLTVEADLSLQSADANRTRLVADLTFTNRHDVDVTLTAFAYELRVDELMLATNTTSGEVAMRPRAEHQESLVISFPTDFVSAWLKNHVEAGEKSTVVFSGNATFGVGSKNQTVEFEESNPFSTNVRGSLQESENCPQPSPKPCVDGATATWRERNQTRVLEMALDMRNTVDREVKIDHPRASLRWGDVQVASAETGGVILAGEAVEALEFALFMEHEQLKEWWPQHLDDCEKSPLTLAVSFTYQVEPEDRSTSTPTPTTVSTPPTFTPPTSTTPTTTSTSTSASPTTTPTTTTASPPTSPTMTSSSPSPSTTTTSSEPPTTSPTTTSGSNATGDGATVFEAATSRVNYVFVFEPEALQPEEDPETLEAAFDLEGDEIKTGFVCAEESGGILPIG